MSDSLFTSLRKMIDAHSLGGLAGRLGETDQSVSHGLESCIAALLGGLANSARDAGVMRQVFDLASNTPADTLRMPALESALGERGSPLISRGKQLISSLFGSGENAMLESVSRTSGLRLSAVSTLMSLAAPMVLGFLGR